MSKDDWEWLELEMLYYAVQELFNVIFADRTWWGAGEY